MIVGAAALGLLIPRSAQAGKTTADAYLGHFRHVGGDKELEARDRAIDDVVAGMSIFVRGIARGRLKDANPISVTMALDTDGSSLTVRNDTRVFTAPLDGSKVKVKASTGDDMLMHFDINDERLDQVFSADDKGRRNRFTNDKGQLMLDVLVHADKLPKPLAYRLTYDRA